VVICMDCQIAIFKLEKQSGKAAWSNHSLDSSVSDRYKFTNKTTPQKIAYKEKATLSSRLSY
jgi:hypothetical protein